MVLEIELAAIHGTLVPLWRANERPLWTSVREPHPSPQHGHRFIQKVPVQPSDFSYFSTHHPSSPCGAPRDYPPVEEMADHHQVKTSFLFIQLQAPSKACGPPHPANTACSGTAEEELSPRPASDGESLHHGSPTVSLPLNAPGSYTDAVSDRSGEGTPESSVCPSDTSTGDATQVAGDPRNQESLCLSAERSDVVCEDAGNPDLDTPVWILRQDTPESMSAEIGPLVAGMGVTTPAAPSSPGAQGRVSFLHPAGGSGASHKTPDCGVEKDAVGGSSQCVYPAPALSVACPPAPGADTAHWGEESSKQSKTFLSAVIERSAKIPGEPYRKNVDRSSSMSSPGPETSAAAKPAPELSPMASAEPWPPATDGPPPHRPPTAAQKVSLCFSCSGCWW
ncbi:hypothetical protein COCON_G00168940 [Conger conger]|uniref:Uncharacterized protein n=1 Tax=Conger conger TaxID=82655 RepID=A0A9Q1HU34_CONCO|nr:hypothetical protein COCON_G00168940 [Conger conger]